MATNKKSFVFYCDWIDTFKALPKDKGYDLLIHLLAYVNDENPQCDDVLVNAVFQNIKNTLKRDLKKYENRAETSRINGKLGGRPKEPKKPSGLKNNLNEPKKPDSVNVSVNVSDSVNDIVNDILLEKETKDTNAKDLANGVIEYFNGVCINLPKVIKVSASRKKAIESRVKEFGKDDLRKVIDLTSQSDFLNGKNSSGWTASFDWIIKPSNFTKILELNYINKNGETKRNITREQFEHSIDKHFNNQQQ